jgi:hypothetical protein
MVAGVGFFTDACVIMAHPSRIDCIDTLSNFSAMISSLLISHRQCWDMSMDIVSFEERSHLTLEVNNVH